MRKRPDLIERNRARRLSILGRLEQKFIPEPNTDVLAIYFDQRSSTVIAAEYSISFGRVCKIRRGKAWAWLTRGEK